MGIDISVAKSIIAKGVAHNDQELVKMGLAMLEAVPANEAAVLEKPVKQKRTPKAATKKAVVKKVATKKVAEPVTARLDKKNLADQFKVKEDRPQNKGIPVRGNGVNKWVDDLTEARGETYETPIAPRAARTREPVQLVEIVCGLDEEGERREDDGCGKVVQCHPALVKDLFICDDCIEKKRKGKR